MKISRLQFDDTACCVKTGSIEYIITVLYSFHKNIQLTYEVKTNGK